MNDEKKISIAVIRRLPRYYRYLKELLNLGITRISSKELSEKMNITASQIRQDLNNFGGFGQQGYGYNVEHLYDEIEKILGLNKTYNLIVIGAGNLGQALANYPNFERRGFYIKALFDSNPKVVGLTIKGIPVYDIDTLEDYINNNKTSIAILTIPPTAANEMVERLIAQGLNNIWNFSPADLCTFEDRAIIENVHLSDSLMTLSYRINEKS